MTVEASSAPPARHGTADPAAIFEPVRGRLGAVIALSAVGAAAGIVPYLAVAELARVLLGPADSATAGQAWLAVLIAAAALVVGVGASFLANLLGHFADAELQLSLRRRIVRHLRRLPLGWFDRNSSGSVRKLVDNDVVALHQLIAHSVHDVVTAIVVPLASLIYLVATDWRLALAALAPVLVAAVLYLVMMRDGTEQYRRYDEAAAALTGATVEFAQGIAVVKRFGQLGRSHRRYRDATDEYVTFVDRWTRSSATMFTLIELVVSPAMVLLWLLAVGIWLVAAGTLDPVDILPGLLLGLGVSAPVLRLEATGQTIHTATKARAALAEFLGLPTLHEPTAPARAAGADLALDGVGFSYDGEHDVLADIAAASPPGTVTALVGPSGSGKSTLAHVVARFYDVDRGAVRVGGADVRALGTAALYREVGFVFQDVQLLRTSLRDNIRLARPDATAAEIEDAARAAQIHERILRLDRGYDAVIGDDARLSGGEAQRVTIARALLADTPVLVLDEATAFADPDSEAAIQRALTRLTTGRTVLVIAHRLHTIVGADQILVLDSGRIVERGTHPELVAADGVYAGMWASYRGHHDRRRPGERPA